MGGTPPIPFTSICKYAEAFGFVGEEFDELNFFVRQMDNEFMDFRKKSSDTKPTNNTVTF